MDKIHAAWEGGGSVIFDMSTIACRDALLLEADGLAKSMIPAPDFYVISARNQACDFRGGPKSSSMVCMSGPLRRMALTN
jgi:hypothetical protein